MIIAVCYFMFLRESLSLLFFFNYPPTTEIYTLSLHDALPILKRRDSQRHVSAVTSAGHGNPLAIQSRLRRNPVKQRDRKSTRLNSSHRTISYAVFCLKKKKH